LPTLQPIEALFNSTNFLKGWRSQPFRKFVGFQEGAKRYIFVNPNIYEWLDELLGIRNLKTQKAVAHAQRALQLFGF